MIMKGDYEGIFGAGMPQVSERIDRRNDDIDIWIVGNEAQ